MPIVLNILAAMGAMFVKDSVVTVMIIMQSRGRARIAGNLAAVSDVAGWLVTLTSAGPAIKHGLTLRAIIIVLAMAITSKFGTTFWTRIGNKLAREGEQGLHDHAIAEIPVLSQRITALEEQIGV